MVNKVVLVGRLCTDPEMKYTPSGVAVANFRVAVDRPFTNAGGERETDFIDVVAWRQSAEFVNTYLGKGRLVLVDGRLQVRQWQTQDGQRRRSTEVVADQVRALDKPREQGERDGVVARSAATPHRENGAVPPEHEHEPDIMPDYEVPDITDPFADQ
jgi:single-strand DNA-binding protein